MRARRRRGTPRVPAEDPDFNRALEAMTAPELRAFVRGVLDGLDPDARTEIVDTLMARAVKGHAGWKPSRPSQRIVEDAKSFAEAAHVRGIRRPDRRQPSTCVSAARRSSPATMAVPEACSRRSCRRLPSPTSTWASTNWSTRSSGLTRTRASRSTSRACTRRLPSRIAPPRCTQPSSRSKASPLCSIRSRTWKTCRPERCPISTHSYRCGRRVFGVVGHLKTNGKATPSAGTARRSFVRKESMDSSNSRERRSAHNRVWPGARRSWTVSTGQKPSGRSMPRRRSSASPTGEGSFSTGPRSPLNNSDGPTCRGVWKPRGVVRPRSRAYRAG